MISPKCDKCKEELEEFGAIILSPPIFPGDSTPLLEGLTYKFHICRKCSVGLLDWMENK